MGKEFALAIPLYLLLILIEAGYGAWKKQHLYRFNDTIANLNSGVLSIIYGFGPKATLFFMYVWVYEHCRIADYPKTWWTSALFLVITDFCAYWFHRFSHEINLLWGSHKVHHQSEDFNFSVALRQSANGLIPSVVFFLPAAFFGVDPASFALMSTLNLVYQFLMHTKIVGKLPKPIEYIFCTPSHHRVHHGMNPKYLDKNYGGILILWDRWFGTFQQEEEAVKYGITTPFNSWNPVWANIEHFIYIFKTVPTIHNFYDKMKFIFGKPGWLPEENGGPMPPKDRLIGYKIYDTTLSPSIKAYVLFQFIISFSLFYFVYMNRSQFTNNEFYAYFGLPMVWSFINISGLSEGKGWAWMSEILRNAISPIVLFYLIHDLHAFVLPYSLACICSLVGLFFLRSELDDELTKIKEQWLKFF